MTETPDSEPAGKSGPNTAVTIGIVALAVALAGGGLWWLLTSQLPAPAPAPAPAPVAAPAPPPPPPPPPPLQLDSSPSPYPLSRWQLAEPPIFGGKVESAKILGRSDANAQDNLRLDDVVELTGWAGDAALGMRIQTVLFSACDEIFASVPVNGPRPDIAQSVHRNLTPSGWTVRFMIAHVPRCARTEVRIWAAAPGRSLLLPFETLLPLQATPIGVERLPATVSRGALAQPPRQLLEPKSFTVPGPGAVTLRGCGATDCASTGTLARGRHAGFVIEAGPEWSLIAVGQRAGWIANASVQIAPYEANPPPAAPAAGAAPGGAAPGGAAPAGGAPPVPPPLPKPPG